MQLRQWLPGVVIAALLLTGTAGCRRLIQGLKSSPSPSPGISLGNTPVNSPGNGMGHPKPAGGNQCLKDALQQIGLTDSQRSQIKSQHRQELSQVEAILNGDQQQQFRQALRSDHNLKRALDGLSLTSGQQQQIQTLERGERQQLMGVLNSSQKSQLRQAFRQCRG